MLVKDREERLARKLEKDKRNATDQLTNPRTRSQESGTQPTKQQRRNEPEAPKKTTKSWTPLKIIQRTQEDSTDPMWKAVLAYSQMAKKISHG